MSTFDVGIRCKFLITMKDASARVEGDQFVGIHGTDIAHVGPWDDALASRCKKLIDASRHVVLPGLVNAHTHLAMTLFRGFEDEVPFQKWLFERILPMENAVVDADFVRTGTMLGAAESIRFGVTTVNDMYFYADEIAKTLDAVGLRARVAQVWSDFPLPEDKDLGRNKVELFERFYSNWHSHSRVLPAYGPHAPYTCSDSILESIVRLQEKWPAPIHIHLSETEKEVRDSKAQHKQSPVERLMNLGVLGPRTSCAHAVHVSAHDVDLLAESGASVVYNPDSNLKLSSGIAPIPHYLLRKINVAIGTDGAASNNNLNIFGAMNIGAKIQKLANNDSTAMTAEQALRAATIGGARALGLEGAIGSIEVSKRADVICVDLNHPHLQPTNDIVSHLVYAATGLEVSDVVCDGAVLLQNYKHTRLDTDSVYRKADEWRRKIYALLSKMKS